MHCAKCKAELGSGSRFCSKCGNSIGASTGQDQGNYYDDQYSSWYSIFIFAMVDGKEYRYYVENGSSIHRIGPEGGGDENLEMNSFIAAL